MKKETEYKSKDWFVLTYPFCSLICRTKTVYITSMKILKRQKKKKKKKTDIPSHSQELN